ncbi:hypothetical protein DFH07DRAFT_830856 [Mycena maculata]|uniref:RNI-like protein n=1 Tax=Mycena maculata TaxID=230809 RepID=A0AAD7N5P3_9AGAR|nr:hypothetical protein DFH07DRAFT_830856 [Mycena maculata]
MTTTRRSMSGALKSFKLTVCQAQCRPRCRLFATEVSLTPSRVQVYAKRLQAVIDQGFHPAAVPDSITELPFRKFASPIAALVFPQFTQIKADIHYELALRRARRVVRERQEEESARREAECQAAEEQGEWRGQEEDPVSLAGPSARPMPVAIGTDEDFNGLLQFLQRNFDPKEILASDKQDIRDELTSTLGMRPGEELKWNTPLLEFQRGAVYVDGRLDLCKKVLGPTHVEKLFDALDRNTLITQVLIGNNVISATGARRVARFIAEHPDRIETWYLAGNHLCPPGFKLLVDAMVKSPRITNIWLKRNPLTPDSVENIVRLITQTPNLRTLDLQNTELGDEGVVGLMAAITGKNVPLRHFYLSANGVGQNAAAGIAAYLAHPACKLESLYIAANPIGDAGAVPLADALKSNSSLLRFNMSSTGLTSTSVSALCTALGTHPRIMSVELGVANTTKPFRQRYNHINDRAIPHLIALMQHAPMRHFDLGRTALSAAGLEAVKAAVAASNLCEFQAHRRRKHNQWREKGPTAKRPSSLPLRRALEANVRRFFPAEESYESFSEGLGARFLYSPEDVRLTDSVYRTRDNRNEKNAAQVWEDGDPVWELVEADAQMLESGTA